MKKTVWKTIGLVALCVLFSVGAVTILPVYQGGTGDSTLTAHGVLLGEGTSPVAAVTPGTAGYVLISNGASLDPSYAPGPPGGSGAGFAWGGSGVDGAITADGSTTYPCLGAPGTFNGVTNAYAQLGDCNATTFVVNSGVSILTGFNRIFATTSVTINGTVRNNGNNATNSGSGSLFAGGSAPTIQSDTTLANGSMGCIWRTPGAINACQTAITGSVGGTGGALGAAGGSGGTATAGTSANAFICPSIGQAGQRGGSGGTGTSGAGGTSPVGGAAINCPVNNLAGSARQIYSLPIGIEFIGENSGGTWSNIGYLPTNAGSTGGGGGGADASNRGGGGGAGGTTGGYGGAIVISSPTITVSATGTISATGGNGGNAGNGANGTGGNTGGGGGGGGGDGGNGGVITLVYHTYTNSGTVTVAGGNPGSHGTHGNGVGSGTNGSDGTDGLAGIAGVVIQIPM